MKRIAVTLSIIAALLLSVNLEAQERRSGIRAGYLRSASELSGTSALDGFYVGFAHDNPIGQSKILWIHGGTEYTQAGWSITDNTFHRLHYISLPGALKVKLGPVFIQGGLALNFKVAERVYIDGADAKTDDNKSKIFNLPVHAGLGLMLGPVLVEARYNYGLLKVHDDGYHVGYLQLGAGLLF
ncbi:MAG: outer membrane beta-barrel protein [Bacteroidales bacterium]